MELACDQQRRCATQRSEAGAEPDPSEVMRAGSHGLFQGRPIAWKRHTKLSVTGSSWTARQKLERSGSHTTGRAHLFYDGTRPAPSEVCVKTTRKRFQAQAEEVPRVQGGWNAWENGAIGQPGD